VTNEENYEIEILIDTLKANIKVLDMLNKSDKKDKKYYLLCVTQELKELCKNIIPILNTSISYQA